jgi:hypothetical protein
MTRQLLMTPVIGAEFDWTLAASDLARAWARSALAGPRRGVPAPAGLPQPDRLQFDLWPEDLLAQRPWTVRQPDRKWSSAPRPMSLPRRRLSAKERAIAQARQQLAGAEVEIPRPRVRGDCASVPRPCPFVSCRHHLYLDVTERGWLKLNFPHLDVLEMAESCSLDVAEREGSRVEDDPLLTANISLEELGKLFNVSLEGARQSEIDAREELKEKLRSWGSE